MKFKILAFLCTGLFLLTSCGGEDCTTETVLGTYVGTNDCDPDDIKEVTYVVTSSGDNVTITSDEGSTWTAKLEGCSTETYEETVDFLGLMVTTVLDATFTDTDLTIVLDATVDGTNAVCTTVYTKQ